VYGNQQIFAPLNRFVCQLVRTVNCTDERKHVIFSLSPRLSCSIIYYIIIYYYGFYFLFFQVKCHLTPYIDYIMYIIQADSRSERGLHSSPSAAAVVVVG